MKQLLFFASILFLYTCDKSEGTSETEDPVEQPITADISVSSSSSLINWMDQDDLIQQLNNVLTYNYSNALESETETDQTFATDSSQVITRIDFKQAYQSVYNDPNTANNAVIVFLTKDSPPGSNAVELDADGPGNTYDLITSVLAPGYNPIETPDCSHNAFGNHIDELFDSELNTNVFRFYIHTTPDDDRCINFDRQRNEIKSYGNSPDNLLGVVNETVVYKWRFKLAPGFQSSPNFTHLHQLKSVGGDFASMPMYTLTARKSSPDRLELRYAETDNQITLSQTPIAPLIGTWLEVTETILYGTAGTYAIEIKKVSDDTVLFNYSNSSIINWRPDAEFVRPKWGIYRSLINAQDLRDEEVLFANFSIEEIE